jgi:hypothetical protein
MEKTIMADTEYVQDPALLQQLNEGYVTDPAILEALNQPTTATEVLNEPQTAFQKFTSPTEPTPFNLKNVAADVAIGAGTGALLGSPTWVGTVPAAGLGGFLGLTGGVAGETARTLGASPATQMAAETVASLGTQGALMGIKGAAKLLPWKGRVLTNLIPNNVEQRAAIVVGEKMFGKDTYGVLHTTENSEAAQTALKAQIFGNLCSCIEATSYLTSVILVVDLRSSEHYVIPLLTSFKVIVSSPTTSKCCRSISRILHWQY